MTDEHQTGGHHLMELCETPTCDRRPDRLVTDYSASNGRALRDLCGPCASAYKRGAAPRRRQAYRFARKRTRSRLAAATTGIILALWWCITEYLGRRRIGRGTWYYDR